MSQMWNHINVRRPVLLHLTLAGHPQTQMCFGHTFSVDRSVEVVKHRDFTAWLQTLTITRVYISMYLNVIHSLMVMACDLGSVKVWNDKTGQWVQKAGETTLFNERKSVATILNALVKIYTIAVHHLRVLVFSVLKDVIIRESTYNSISKLYWLLVELPMVF